MSENKQNGCVPCAGTGQLGTDLCPHCAGAGSVKPVAGSDSFIARQTENIRAIFEASEKWRGSSNGALLYEHERQKCVVTLDVTTRCVRCGTEAMPFVKMPGPYICKACWSELKARDQADVPGCSWWGELIGHFKTKEASL